MKNGERQLGKAYEKNHNNDDENKKHRLIGIPIYKW